jgi:hypothetical protein
MSALNYNYRIMFFQSQMQFIYLVTNITSPTINVAAVNINDRMVHLERSVVICYQLVLMKSYYRLPSFWPWLLYYCKENPHLLQNLGLRR